jgi:hypothetical protein
MEYKVKKLLNSRMHHGKLQFLVKWKGYPNKENTWEPETPSKKVERKSRISTRPGPQHHDI